MSSQRQAAAVLSGSLLLLLATLGVLGLESAAAGRGQRQAARRFQTMAGGLGLGASVAPRWCFVNFDPRLEHCTCPEQPLPGIGCYCPEHAWTVTCFPNLPPEPIPRAALPTSRP